MQAKFIGVPGEDIDPIEMYGQTFYKGEWTDVPAGLATRKLQDHPHFESKFDKSEIAEDAKVKGEFEKLADAQLARAEEQQEQDEADAEEQAKINAKADEVADEGKADTVIDSADEYQRSEGAVAAAFAPPLTEPIKSAFDYQVREAADQVPAPVVPDEEPKRGPGRPRKGS